MVSSATQDMGGGTYTTMTQVVSDVTGIPMERIRPELGDSHMPPAPVSGGSMTTASVLPAVRQAAAEALKRIVQAAIADEKSPLHGKKEEEVVAANGRVFPTGFSSRIRYSLRAGARCNQPGCSRRRQLHAAGQGTRGVWRFSRGERSSSRSKWTRR